MCFLEERREREREDLEADEERGNGPLPGLLTRLRSRGSPNREGRRISKADGLGAEGAWVGRRTGEDPTFVYARLKFSVGFQ